MLDSDAPPSVCQLILILYTIIWTHSGPQLHALLQGLPCQTYIAAFDRMQSVVFVNAFGNEVAIWKELTGSQLSEKYYEGISQSCSGL